MGSNIYSDGWRYGRSSVNMMKKPVPIHWLAAFIYFAVLLFTLLTKSDRLFALFLVTGIPALALVKPRLAVCIMLVSYSISPMQMFFPPAYLADQAGTRRMIFEIGGVGLNFFAIVKLSIIFTSIFAIVATGKSRGVRVVAYKFLPFFLVATIVWLWRDLTMQGVRTIFTFLTQVVLASSVYAVINNLKSIEEIKKAILFAMPLSIVISLGLDFANIRSAWPPPNPARIHIIRFMGANIPAVTAILCVPPLALLLAEIVEGEKGRWGMVLFLIIVAAATVSRTATAVLIVMITFAVVMKRKGKIIAVLLILLIGGITVGTYGKAFLARNASHESGESINTSARLPMWKNIAKMAMKRPLLGYGLGKDIEMYQEKSSTLNMPHNEYLRLWFSVGIIGALAYFYAIYALLRQSAGRVSTSITSKTRWAALFALLGTSLLAVTDNPISSVAYMAPTFAIMVMAIKARELEFPIAAHGRTRYA